MVYKFGSNDFMLQVSCAEIEWDENASTAVNAESFASPQPRKAIVFTLHNKRSSVGPADKPYLMHEYVGNPFVPGATAIIFDDYTRAQIDLNRKESVER